MTAIIKAANAADFLVLVPHLAGYTPTQSIALVPFHGNRTIGVMRFDLPPADAGDELDRIAATFVGMVCKLADADGVTPVVFTDDPFRRDDDIVHGELVRAVIRRADACGLRIVDALCLAADGWGSYLDPECPPEGRPRTELPAELAVPEPRDVSGDQAAGVELPAADLAEKERVGAALRSIEATARVVCGEADPASMADLDPRAIAAVGRLDDIPLLFEDALHWDTEHLEPFEAAALMWCLARPSLRDVALSQWSGDIVSGDDALEAQRRWEDGEAYPDDLALVMFGEGPRPDPERLQKGLDLARRLAAAAPRDAKPAMLATASWLAWALGRSTYAHWHCSRALELDADHGLAGIVASFVEAGHLPEWAFDRPCPGD
ncbi:MAG TPA: DUF4192 family protein [Microbacterium sp.]|uniref:DUF4192 family protein n=1 Tax=Microbacterium sp. TaxID=51671 RepID=UPI002B603963|nr:DUF4192 family protein [Microbacterium sp.]HWI31109.1 DUF4192 family protein [Microbacterium sp.]